MRRSLPTRLLDALPLIRPFVGICFRNVAQQYATQRDILSAQGGQFSGGRYNFRGSYPVLYLSCDIHTCVEETSKSFQQAGASVAQALPRTIVGVEVRLARVLDLTDPVVLSVLGITRLRLIRTDWLTCQENEEREAFTQTVGRLARETGVEAILTPSAALPRTGKNLCIFSDQLLPTSRLRAINGQRLPAV